MRLVLDTNIYTDYAQGLPDVVEKIAIHGTQLFIPSVVLGELHYGFMKGSKKQLNEVKLHQFITYLHINIIDVNDEVARKYATIMLSLIKKGTKIPINDVWIAASCMNVGGTLFTRDRHFDAIDQLDRVNSNW
jgi:predicted nucleic acid-binding protein